MRRRRGSGDSAGSTGTSAPGRREADTAVLELPALSRWWTLRLRLFVRTVIPRFPWVLFVLFVWWWIHGELRWRGSLCAAMGALLFSVLAHWVAGLIIIPGQRQTTDWIAWAARQTWLPRTAVATMDKVRRASRNLQRMEKEREKNAQQKLGRFLGRRIRLWTADDTLIDGAVFGAGATASTAAIGLALNQCRGVIVYLGGNNEYWEYSRVIEELRSRDWGVVALNYPGVGLSGGHATRTGLVLAGLAAVEVVIDRWKVPCHRVGLLGHSIGGAVAAEVSCAWDGPLHVILDRTFARLSDVILHLVAPFATYPSLDCSEVEETETETEPDVDEEDEDEGGDSDLPAMPHVRDSLQRRRRRGGGHKELIFAAIRSVVWSFVVSVLGWELDTVACVDALQHNIDAARQRRKRERIMVLARGGAPVPRETFLQASFAADRQHPPECGRWMIAHCPHDQVIPVAAQPQTALARAGRPVPRDQQLQLRSLGLDPHNRPFFPDEWTVLDRFLSAAVRDEDE